MPPSSEVAKAPSRYFDIKHDGAIINAGGFWCGACLFGKPGSDKRSPDPRYCQGCYGFLLKEAEILRPGKYPGWVPKDSQSITRPPPEPSSPPIGHQKPIQVSGGMVLNMSTVESKKDDGKRGPKQKALPQELIKRWAGEGMGSKAIASRLKGELDIKVSYKTVQRVLSGERNILPFI